MQKQKHFRTFLGLAILILAAGLLVAVLFKSEGNGPDEDGESAISESDLALESINYTETRDGVPRWSLKAESASHDLGEGVTRIENIRMVFYDVPELGEVTLTARSGEMQQDPRVILLKGDVAAENGSNFSFYADQVSIDPERRLIRTEEPVRILYQNMNIYGRGMNLEIDERKLTVLSRVETLIDPEKVR